MYINWRREQVIKDAMQPIYTAIRILADAQERIINAAYPEWAEENSTANRILVHAKQYLKAQHPHSFDKERLDGRNFTSQITVAEIFTGL